MLLLLLLLLPTTTGRSASLHQSGFPGGAPALPAPPAIGMQGLFVYTLMWGFPTQGFAPRPTP